MMANTMQTTHETSASNMWFWLAVAVVGGAFFLIDHDLQAARAESFTQTADEMELAAAGGDTLRRIAFVAVGLFGIIGLVRPSTQQFRMRGFAAMLIFLLVGWITASILWSSDTAMTGRRLIVMMCCLLGVLGLCKQLSTRQLLQLVAIVSSTYLSIGVIAEIGLETFRPFGSGYRFAGTLHPNTQGLNLVALCLSTVCLALIHRRWTKWLVTLFCVAFAFLILTKSRTSLGGLVLAGAMIWSLWLPLRRQVLVYVTAGWAVAMIALVLLLSGADYTDQLVDTALLGRSEESSSLTGRIPLWSELSYYVDKRLMTGYGYEAFWTPDRIATVSEEMQWGLREAHSAYIDAVLSIGLVGAALILLAVATGLFHAAVRSVKFRDPAYGFCFGLLVFGLINALTESGMIMPTYATFVAACCLAYAAFHRTNQQQHHVPVASVMAG